MAIFAELRLHQGGVVAWLLLGLLAGALAVRVTSGSGYGMVFDLFLGLLGALVGGILFNLISGSESAGVGDTGFWGSLVMAFLGACFLIVCARFLNLGRKI